MSYGPPDDDPIRDLAGNPAAGFADQAVTNDTPRPMLSSARVGGKKLVLFWDRTLDADSRPATGDFTVVVADGNRGVDGVAVEGTHVILTLASAVAAGQTVKVSYRPDTHPIRDEAGSPAGELADEDVTHNRAPTYDGPAIQDFNALPGLLVTEVLPKRHFNDPDGDPLTITVSSDRPADVYEEDPPEYNERTERVFFFLKKQCALAVIDSALASDFSTVITVTATDLFGATAQVTMTANSELVPDPACLTLESAVVKGATLTLTYNAALSALSTPAPGAFDVKVADTSVDLVADNPVRIAGRSVTLTLAAAVSAGQRVTVTYTGDTPNSRRLGNTVSHAPDLDDHEVINITGDGTAPTLARATVDGDTLTLTWDEPLDLASKPAASAFTVKVASATVTLAATDPVEVTGRSVTLTLAAAVSAGQSVTVSYTPPDDDPIRDFAGNAAAMFTDEDVTNDTGKAVVSSVALVSKPRLDANSDGTNDTYGAGQAIAVEVTWDQDVTWDVSASGGGDAGAPRRRRHHPGGGAGDGRSDRRHRAFAALQLHGGGDRLGHRRRGRDPGRGWFAGGPSRRGDPARPPGRRGVAGPRGAGRAGGPPGGRRQHRARKPRADLRRPDESQHQCATLCSGFDRDTRTPFQRPRR